MGVFNRLSDIINANLNSLLDRAEDPEKLIKLVISEMEETLIEVRSNAAKIIAQRKEVQRKINYTEKRITDWDEKASFALSKGEENLARQALKQKQQEANQLQSVQEEEKRLDEVYTKLDADISALQSKLNDAKARKNALLTRKQAFTVRHKIKQHVNTQKIDEAIEKFEIFERKMDRLEAEIESLDLGKSKTLDKQFEELASIDSVEEELAMLKAKMQKAS